MLFFNTTLSIQSPHTQCYPSTLRAPDYEGVQEYFLRCVGILFGNISRNWRTDRSADILTMESFLVRMIDLPFEIFQSNVRSFDDIAISSWIYWRETTNPQGNLSHQVSLKLQGPISLKCKLPIPGTQLPSFFRTDFWMKFWYGKRGPIHVIANWN